MINGIKFKYPELAEVIPVTVVNGDMTDKGTGNITILLDVYSMSGEVKSLLGNRDANKGRFVEALSTTLQDFFPDFTSNYAY